MTVEVPAAPPAPAPIASLTATPPAAPAPTPVPWLEGADELLVGFAANKGWKKPVDVVDGYKNLESLIGADRAGRTVVLPKADATPEELSAFYTKLGRPEKATEYNLPAAPGADSTFVTAASEKFHELGIPQTSAQKLTEWFNTLATGHEATATVARTAADHADDAALRTEWGSAFDQQLAKARAAVTSAGLNDADIKSMSAALGHKKTMQLFATFGAKTGEDSFVVGDTTASGSALTPAMAKDKISALRTDKAWTDRYFSGGAAEIAEMRRLQDFANPPKPR